jgi:presenilin 1
MNAIKLGLGDFIFYSVLVGRATVTDSITLCLCITAILTVCEEKKYDYVDVY